MGSFYTHKASEWRRMPGKIDTPLNKKLLNVKWGEFNIRNLFNIENTLSFNTDRLVDGNEYDYITRTSLNQGILKTTGYVNDNNINPAGNWSLGLLQMDFFYRKRPWYAGQFVRKITPKFKVTDNIALFFTTVLNRLKNKLLSVLVRDIDKFFLDSKISLPITDEGKADFDFISSFMEELETEYIKVLGAYLKVAGFENYELTDNEKDSLINIKERGWSDYKLGNLFEEISTITLPYKAKELPKNPTGEFILPCLTSSFRNQGLNYYAPKKGATILKNVISIPSNSDVYRAYFQSNEFTVLSDAYAIHWKDSSMQISQNQYLFMVMCINKVTDLPIYSYKNKLGGWNVVKNKYIKLPTKDNKIDFDFMETFITAIKKLVLKYLITYTENKTMMIKS